MLSCNNNNDNHNEGLIFLVRHWLPPTAGQTSENGSCGHR
jgi:hypothetical protein